MSVAPCPCECSHGGFCGGCGHAGCGLRARRAAASPPRKPAIECAFVGCDAHFSTAKAHLAHLAMYHPTNLGEIRKRDVSCWRCAGLIRLPATACPSCGWEHPYLTERGAADEPV